MSLTEQQIPSGLDLLSLCVSRAMEDKAVHMTNLLSVFLFIHSTWSLAVECAFLLFWFFGFFCFICFLREKKETSLLVRERSPTMWES